MNTRQRIGGRSSFGLYAGLIAILTLVALLVYVFYVVMPDRQRQREAEARHVEATATAEAVTAELQRAYAAGIAFASAGDWSKAADELAKVVTLNPGYLDAAARLAQARNQTEGVKATATEVASVSAKAVQVTATAEARSTIEATYQRGLAFAKAGLWNQARVAFEQVVSADPAYKNVQTQLAEAVAELAKMTPTNTPLPAATATPVSVTLKPVSAISFQNEGTASTDDTSLIRDKDGYWAPSLTGTVAQDYYATGIAAEYFDALSLHFDVGDWSYQTDRASLRAFVQHGAYGQVPRYGDNSWITTLLYLASRTQTTRTQGHRGMFLTPEL